MELYAYNESAPKNTYNGAYTSIYGLQSQSLPGTLSHDIQDANRMPSMEADISNARNMMLKRQSSNYTPKAEAQPIGVDLKKSMFQKNRTENVVRNEILTNAAVQKIQNLERKISNNNNDAVTATLSAVKAIMAQYDDDRKAKNLTQVLESHRTATEEGMKSIASGMTRIVDNVVSGASNNAEMSDSQTAAVLKTIRTQLWILGGFLIIVLLSLVIFIAARKPRV